MAWADRWIERRIKLATVRAKIPGRRIGKLVLFVTAFAGVAIIGEAVLRARIGAPEDRLPTAVYTRSVAWGRNSPDAHSIPIGSLDGKPLEWRVPVTLDRIPDHLVQAVLAVEDQRFQAHHGLDLRRIGGAFVANVRAAGIEQGGSTITQQLAKNLYLSASRTPLRKIREAAMALVLELRHDKAIILQAYLNEIYLGQDNGRGIHGVAAAAQYYFGDAIENVSLAEAALLAGMIHAPNRHAPTRHAAAARARRNLVLQLMVDQQRITHDEASRASRARIDARARPERGIDGRHFRDLISPAVTRRLPDRGGAVVTTLDGRLQLAAQRAVHAGMDRRLRASGAEVALVAIDPATGEVLAMIGGRDYGASQFNRATDARRQPGSAFKPIVALTALERREGGAPKFTLASVIEDEPLEVPTPGGVWTPANYDQSFRGRVTLRDAMEQSLNVPFARIGLAVGPQQIAAMARRVGIESPLAAVPSISLGSSEVSLIELVRAYGVLATNGTLAPTRMLLAGSGGNRAAPSETVAPQVIDPAVAYLVTSALEGVIARGTGRALSGRWGYEGIAGKTGTSNDWRDAWFVAYTPRLVVGVWVGFDDARSLRLSGGAAALPIAARFLDDALADEPTERFEVPVGIREGYVGTDDGQWVAQCGMAEVFLEGTEMSGEGCHPIEVPEWDADGDWEAALKREARRFLQDLVQRQLEKVRYGRMRIDRD